MTFSSLNAGMITETWRGSGFAATLCARSLRAFHTLKPARNSNLETPSQIAAVYENVDVDYLWDAYGGPATDVVESYVDDA